MSGRRVLEWLRQGDRIPLLATLGLAVLLGAMAIGPVKSYTAATDRVRQLDQRRAELEARVDRLEARRLELANPDEIELLAREQLGMIRPGEIPYVVVAPSSGGASSQAPSPSPGQSHVGDATAAPVHQPWYRRIGQALRGLHG